MARVPTYRSRRLSLPTPAKASGQTTRCALCSRATPLKKKSKKLAVKQIRRCFPGWTERRYCESSDLGVQTLPETGGMEKLKGGYGPRQLVSPDVSGWRRQASPTKIISLFLYRHGSNHEVISDVICPWCYIGGKRRVEKPFTCLALDGRHEFQVQPGFPFSSIRSAEEKA